MSLDGDVTAPPSPKPKAKLKDSFVIPPPPEDDPPQPAEEENSNMDQTLTERSESFRSIIQRHQELSSSDKPSACVSAPLKRPGILKKKPKDWSSQKSCVQESSSIEIQLNPSQSSSIVVLKRSGSSCSASSLTLEYNSLQEVNDPVAADVANRKLSIDVETSPQLHTSSVTLPTLNVIARNPIKRSQLP